MSQEFNTLELARIYESQGYFQDAFEMYQALAAESEKEDDQEMDPEINAGLHRMQNQAKLPENGLASLAGPMPEKRIEYLLEQWLIVLVLEKRLNIFKQVKSRF